MKSLQEAFDQACTRFNGNDFAQLNEIDKVLVTIWGLEAEVNNGGFDQYYFNRTGDQAYFASTALQTIGAYNMADIVSRANKVFGPDGPSQESNARQSQLFLVSPNNGTPSPWEGLSRAFQDYPDDVAELLTAFLRAAGLLS